MISGRLGRPDHQAMETRSNEISNKSPLTLRTGSSATDVYGVVLNIDGNDVIVRQQATENRREELREKRLENSVVPIQEE